MSKNYNKMKIYRNLRVELDRKTWLPLWRALLRKNNNCPLTGCAVYWAKGENPTIKAQYRIGQKIFIKDHKVLFDENTPSLTESSRCFGAAIRIANPNPQSEEFEFLGIIE